MTDRDKQTYFAPAKRATEDELKQDIDFISHNPIVDTLLATVNGLMAVLNDERQIIGLNEVFFKEIGVNRLDEALGLRPGEAIHCIHAQEMPGGCGTSQHCSTCGAAIAIVAVLAGSGTTERKCAARIQRNGKEVDVSFQVRAMPFLINGRRFILLFLHDITEMERWAVMERGFFHDVSNTITALAGTVEVIDMYIENNERMQEFMKRLRKLTARLGSEIQIQHSLVSAEMGDYQPLMSDKMTSEIVDDLQTFFQHHPAAENRHLHVTNDNPCLIIRSDIDLLLRVLTNMILNAFEASEENDEVRLAISRADNNIGFYVWNRSVIPEDVARRIFQRHFTTKSGSGHGFGTNIMKTFGEQVLKGKVGFSSSPEEGTTFYFMLPL